MLLYADTLKKLRKGKDQMPVHHNPEYPVLVDSPPVLQERINQHDGIYEPAQISDPVCKCRIHAEHPYTVRQQVHVQDKIVHFRPDSVDIDHPVTDDDRDGTVQDEVGAETDDARPVLRHLEIEISRPLRIRHPGKQVLEERDVEDG